MKKVYLNLITILKILLKFFPKAILNDKTGVDEVLKQLKW